jgi:hypothetical protein
LDTLHRKCELPVPILRSSASAFRYIRISKHCTDLMPCAAALCNHPCPTLQPTLTPR